MQPDLALVGLIVGVLVGLTGIGGGSLLVPILIVFFKTDPLTAVGSALFVKAATKVLELGPHVRQGTISYKMGGILAAASVPSALACVGLLYALRHYQIDIGRVVLWSVVVVTVLAGVTMLLRPLYLYRVREAEVRVLAKFKVRLAGSIIGGIASGFIMGLTGIGGSSIIVPVLALLYVMPNRRVTGTDAFHAAILAAVAGGAHLFLGRVDWGTTLNLLVAAVVGVPIGMRLVRPTPEKVLRTALGAVVLALGIWVIFI